MSVHVPIACLTDEADLVPGGEAREVLADDLRESGRAERFGDGDAASEENEQAPRNLSCGLPVE